jgi:hypothetical protein
MSTPGAGRVRTLWSAVERADAIRAQMEIDRARLIAERPHVDDREENGTRCWSTSGWS